MSNEDIKKIDMKEFEVNESKSNGRECFGCG